MVNAATCTGCSLTCAYVFAQLAEMLPTDENFLLLFRRDNTLDSSVEFMRVWREFDKDRSGYIEADELKVNLTFLERKTS